MSRDKKTLEADANAPTAESPKKLLVGKRVLRDFVVRSGLRTGKCNETGDDESVDASTCWCSRSR